MNFNNEVDKYKSCLLRQTQSGTGTPWENSIVFHGRRGQRGFGFGSFLSTIGKAILPIAKTLGKKVVRSALKTGSDIIINQKRPSEALAQRGRELLGEVLSEPPTKRRRTISGKKPRSKWTLTRTHRRA